MEQDRGSYSKSFPPVSLDLLPNAPATTNLPTPIFHQWKPLPLRQVDQQTDLELHFFVAQYCFDFWHDHSSSGKGQIWPIDRTCTINPDELPFCFEDLEPTNSNRPVSSDEDDPSTAYGGCVMTDPSSPNSLGNTRDNVNSSHNCSMRSLASSAKSNEGICIAQGSDHTCNDSGGRRSGGHGANTSSNHDGGGLEDTGGGGDGDNHGNKTDHQSEMLSKSQEKDNGNGTRWVSVIAA
ncbi:hypothetical protein FA15DRAFT_661811 [Coprinopsis marcescibilis]|uniref:Uncharacterized protein n=1 Tax=Coprinopsis marcescibilis TaxID=230819 RepID=A0A5C3KAL3_COPMA|nr:hypothetical protein FA15DRAFT_661811 [Coprinopsis marcescibilis]